MTHDAVGFAGGFSFPGRSFSQANNAAKIAFGRFTKDMAMEKQDTLDIGKVASLLFFTRAAAEADPALASSALRAPFLP